MTNIPLLIALDGPRENEPIPLIFSNFEGFFIGRDPPGDLMINWEASVSRHHSRIFSKSGLYWLEDLSSTNGTWFSLPGGLERRVPPQSPVLLLEGSIIRLGKSARFLVKDLAASQDDAVRYVMGILQRNLSEVYTSLDSLTPEARDIRCDWLGEFETRLSQADSEQELLVIALEGVEKLKDVGYTQSTQLINNNTIVINNSELPPIPTDLPNPGDENRLPTIRDYLISNLHHCFPKEPVMKPSKDSSKD